MRSDLIRLNPLIIWVSQGPQQGEPQAATTSQTKSSALLAQLEAKRRLDSLEPQMGSVSRSHRGKVSLQTSLDMTAQNLSWHLVPAACGGSESQELHKLGAWADGSVWLSGAHLPQGPAWTSRVV